MRTGETLRLAVWNPDERAVKFLGINALPFGAIGSVSAFFEDIHGSLVPGDSWTPRLCWTSFFDDFTVLSKRLSSNSAAIASESLFNLLGIQFARDGKKAVDWDTTVKTLGVQFNLRPSEQKGVVLLGHTESRIEELKNCIEQFSGIRCHDAQRC